MAQVAILIPLMRPHKIAPLVANIQEVTDDCHIVVIAAGNCADAARELPVTLLEDGGASWARRINAGYLLTNAPTILTAADDLLFHPDWFRPLQLALDRIEGGGVCAVNDRHNMAGVHFGISKSYLESIGGVLDQPPGTVCCESYDHSYVDDEIRSTAIYHNRWGGVVTDSVVEHMHPGAGKSATDEIYKIGEASMSQGHAVYASRAHLWTKENA